MRFMKQSLLKVIVVPIMLGLEVTLSHAQAQQQHTVYESSNYNIVSPHVADMFHYGEFGTSLFTGRMQQTIPIYTLDDPDFKMNIALHYNAEGFKPRKHSGYVGYNWFLEAGGCITREVNGYPDEIEGRELRDNNIAVGMYCYAIKHPIVDKRAIFNFDNREITYGSFDGVFCYNVGHDRNRDVDYLPDLFHFDFLGYKGSFMINNAGKIQIISGDFVDVDLSGIIDNMPLSSSFPCPQENSSITVKTKDGYTYIFGGDYSKLEYTISAISRSEFWKKPKIEKGQTTSPEIADPESCWPATVNTWYLAKIIAPNKRVVTFQYMAADRENSNSKPDKDCSLWEFNEYYDRCASYYQALVASRETPIDNDWNGYELFPPEYRNHIQCSYSMTKKCVLESINISGKQPLKIVFVNSREEIAMYHSSRFNYGSHVKRSRQLDTIRVVAAGNTIKTAVLSYNNVAATPPLLDSTIYIPGIGFYTFDSTYYAGISYNWRFLSAVNISGVGKYEMKYYHEKKYPWLDPPTQNYLEEEADAYGYWVGDCKQALLKEITFPTGGRQTYSYSQHSYQNNRKYYMNGDSYVMMKTIKKNGTIKGARINSVETYDGNNNPIETRLYYYEDGVFHDNLYIYGLNKKLAEREWPIHSRCNYSLLDTHIGYGKVTEMVYDTKNIYYTTYRFDTGMDYYDARKDYDMNIFCHDNNSKLAILAGPLFYDSRLIKWGKLLSAETYNSNGKLLKSTSYEYNDVSNRPINSNVASTHNIKSLGSTDTIVMFSHYNGASISKRLYVYPDVIAKEITKDYSEKNSIPLEKERTFRYDSKLRVKTETINDSRDMQHFTRYTYPDMVCKADQNDTSALAILVKANRINTPIETVSGYIDEGNNEKITSGSISLYAKDRGVTDNPFTPRPSLRAPGVSETNIPDSWHQSDDVINGLIDQYVTEIVNYPYLFQTLSLAMTEPITNYQPMRMGSSDVTYDPRYKLDAEYKFDAMNRLTSIKPFGQMETTYTWNGIYPTSKTIGNQTWKYSFIPHVGVKEIVDPRGIITRYEYDNTGRLIKESQVIDGKEQILNVYQYHIKSEK